MKHLPSLRSTLAVSLLVSLAVGARASYSWGPSGLVGAGTQNCIAIQPGGTGVRVSASDISGFQRSTDYGVHWKSCNVGTPTGGPSKVACVIFSNNPSTPNTVYAGTGSEGAGGGFLASTDGGQTWSVRSTVPQFSGNGENTSDYPNLPNRWPRSTGNLIALDETGATKYIYAGTFNDGVMRSTDGGNTWALVGLAGKFIRSIAIDPNAPWKIFATDYASNVWYCNAARGTTNTGTGTTGWTHQTNAPTTIEEMVFVGSTLYAAGKSGSTGGVWKTADSGTTWTRIGASAIDTTATWTAIAGYVNGSSHMLYIGATDPVQQSGDANFRNILKSTDSGATWSPVTLAANIVNEIGGAGGPAWWLGLPSGGSFYLLGRGSCDLANIQIDPVDRNKVFVSGRGGIWGTTNALAANTSVRWYPKVGGLMVTVGTWVATDPNIPGRVYVGNEDWIFFYSSDFGTTFRRNASGMTHGNTSRCIYVDPTDSKVYCGTLDDAGTNGDVYSHADPTLGTAWTSEGLAAAVPNKNLRGVCAVHTGATRYVLAAVEGSGLWRKSGSTWSLVSSLIKPSGAVTTTFAWRPGTPYVFVYEKSTGLWRSSDYGATWGSAPIWAVTSGATGSGFVVQNPNVTGQIYTSVASGVFRFTNAQTGTPTPTNIGGPTNPGALAWANNELYACDIVSGSHNGRLYKWSNPASSGTSVLISDTVDYPGQSNWPTGLAVDPSGIVHVSNRGNSVMSGATDTLLADDFEDGNATGWNAEVGTWTVVTDGTKVYQSSTATGGRSLAGSLSWSDYSVQADIKVTSLGSGALGISARYQDFNNRYFLLFNGAGDLALKKSVGGVQTVLSSVPFTAVNGSTYTLKLVVNGSTLEAYLNGVLKMTTTDTTFTTGQIALNSFNATGEFDNVLVNAAN